MTSLSAVVSSVRPGLREALQPSSPHTPSRFISSTFSSPGSAFRQEEDAVVFEIGSRYLRAGFEGEAGPQCEFKFGPEGARRVGDYRGWAQGRISKDEEIERWDKEHELWSMDLADVDLGLFEDKLERTVREIYNKYLLTDAGSARLVVVLPSILPHPILSSFLTTMFNRWKYPTITLLPAPAMAAIAAGLRSALVVDVGWHETISTALYEYRETKVIGSTRAMKSLTEDVGKRLKEAKEAGLYGLNDSTPITFDIIEEVVVRLACCKPAQTQESVDMTANTSRLSSLSIASPRNESSTKFTTDAVVEIEWPSRTSSQLVKLPLATVFEPVEATFFAPQTPSQQLDDHEWSLPLLVYKALLALPPDVRALCMPRIVFVGGGSNIPGLCARVLEEVAMMLEKHGWNPVRGKVVDERREKVTELSQERNGPPSARHGVPLPPDMDFVEEKIQKQASKDVQQQLCGVLRQVESLGSWSGASLLASLKVKGHVEVEREKYLSHGLNGAHRDVEVSVMPKRLSHGPGLSKSSGNRSSWTLAGWAS